MLVIPKNEKGNVYYPYELDFTFEQGEHQAEKYKITCIICDNPLCRCQTLELECKEINPDPSSRRFRSRKYYCFLDVGKRKAVKGDRHTTGDSNFGQALCNALQDTDWDDLTSLFYGYKTAISDNCNIDELEADFPIPEIEEKHLLVCYRDIFPFSRELILDIEGKKYALGDQYCLNSKCSCTNVTLTLLQIKDSIAKQSSASPVFSFDYRSNKWEIYATGGKSPAILNALIQQIPAQHPGIESLFTKRHNDLRILYKKCLKKQNYPLPLPPQKNPVPVQAKTGRNAPCPCGNGRKYKHCCGA